MQGNACSQDDLLQGLQAVLLQLLPLYQDSASLAAARSSCDTVGLPKTHPALFQPKLLSKVCNEAVARHPELVASCMTWFIDSVTSAMDLEDQPAISGTVMSPYLQLIRKFACTYSADCVLQL